VDAERFEDVSSAVAVDPVWVGGEHVLEDGDEDEAVPS
jgi:hypothetical protein